MKKAKIILLAMCCLLLAGCGKQNKASDISSIDEIFRLDVMLNLAKEGMTMLIVTHEMGFARSVADRVVFMDDGQIVEISKPDEFFSSPKTDRAKKFLNMFDFS